MGINKLIADMDLDIVDLSDDESTGKTGLKPKGGTAAINSGNETETNKEDREIKMLNENESGINWDLLEMESDNEKFETQKESQASGNSVLLLEAGSDPLVLSNREDHLNMNNNNSLDLDMREKGDQLKGLSQNNAVCSSESRVGSEDMAVELSLVSEDIDIENEKREGLNDNIDLDLNANKKLHLSLGMDIENLKGLTENSTISDAENKENFAEKRLGLVLGSTDDKMENENMQALDKTVDLDADKIKRVGLYLGKPRDFDVVIESNVDTTLEKRHKSEKLEMQIILENGDKEPRIDYMDGLNDNSDSGTCAINRMCLGPGEVDGLLKDSKGSSVVSCFESKNSSDKMDLVTIFLKKDKEMDNEKIEGAMANVDVVLKEGVNSEVLIKDSKAGFSENKDKGEEVDREKLNLEVVVANSTAFSGDPEVNGFQLVAYTGVQDTIVASSKGVVINKGQKEIIEPLLDNANTDFGSNFEPSNNVGLTMSNNEMETMNPGSPLSSILDSKSPKRRGRPRNGKGKMNDTSTDLALVAYNSGENSKSRGKRDRKESKYLSHPYTIIEFSPKKPKIDLVTNGETNNAKEGKKMKTDMDSQQVAVELISTAQGPLNHQQTKLTIAAKGFLTSFRDSVCNKVNVKTSQEVWPLTSGPTEVHRDHHVLLNAKHKLDGIISSLTGSGLENKESLVGDVRGLVDKINLILAKDFNRTLESNLGNRGLQPQIINLE